MKSKLETIWVTVKGKRGIHLAALPGASCVSDAHLDAGTVSRWQTWCVTVGAVACALPLFSEVLTSSSPLPFISDLKASVQRLNWSEGPLPGNRHMIGTTEA